MLFTLHQPDLYVFSLFVYSNEIVIGLKEFLKPVYLLTIYTELLESEEKG